MNIETNLHEDYVNFVASSFREHVNTTKKTIHT